MTDENPPPADHWGAPEVSPTADHTVEDSPAGSPTRRSRREAERTQRREARPRARQESSPRARQESSPRARQESSPRARQESSPAQPRGLTYGILGAAAAITLMGSAILAVRAFDTTSRSAAPLPGHRFTVQGAPAPTASTGRRRISPDGAPYSYLLPDGFVTAPVPKSTGTGQAGVFETAITPRTARGGDIIAVSVYGLGADSERYSYDQLQSEIDRLTRQVAEKPGVAARVRVSGRRALRYLFDYGGTRVLNYFVFSHSIEVQVRCQWTNAEPVIRQGCDDVVSTLRIS